MDEQQIIDDILDKLYGYNSVLKEKDPEVIKAKKKEKEEKSEEMKVQINNICRDLEKELKEVFGSDMGEMKKTIRLQVLSSIKAEIDNGNSVVDANGKIGKGKIFDIIKQSKSEILDNAKFKNNNVDYKNENEDIIFEDAKEDNELKNIFEQLDSFGIDLTDDDKDLIAEAIAKVNELMEIVKEKMDSGMSNEEAWMSILEGKSNEEIEILEMYFILAGITTPFRTKEVEQEKDTSNDEEKIPSMDEKTPSVDEKTPSVDEKTGPSLEGNGTLVVPRQNIKNTNADAFFKACEKAKSYKVDRYIPVTDGSKVHRLKTTVQKIASAPNLVKDVEDSIEVYLRDFRMNIQQSGNLGIDDREVSSFTIADNGRSNYEVMQEELRNYEIGHIPAMPKINAGNGVAKKIAQVEDIKEIREAQEAFKTHAKHTTYYDISALGDGRKIGDECFNQYFLQKKEDMRVSGSDVDKTPIETSSLYRTALTEMEEAIRDSEIEEIPPTVPISGTIIEKIIVDEAGGRQEGQTEPQSTAHIDMSAIMALIESQGRAREIFAAREILAASDIIQGSARADGTTEEKKNSPGTTVIDNDEKNGETPDDH